MSGLIDDFAVYLGRLVADIKTKKSFEKLLSMVEGELFDDLLPGLQKRIYSQIISELISQGRDLEAIPYLDRARALPPGEEDQALLLISKILYVHVELIKLTPEVNQRNIRSVLEKCQSLLVVVNTDSLYLQQSKGVILYNIALCHAILGEVRKAVEELNQALKILVKPMDRLVRSRVKCGLAFLTSPSTPSSPTYASELKEEEKASESFSQEVNKWAKICEELKKSESAISSDPTC